MIGGHGINKLLRCFPRLPFLLQFCRQDGVGVRGVLHNLRQPSLRCNPGILQGLLMPERGLYGLLLELPQGGLLGLQRLVVLLEKLLLLA